jgi:hypothetical protein
VSFEKRAVLLNDLSMGSNSSNASAKGTFNTDYKALSSGDDGDDDDESKSVAMNEEIKNPLTELKVGDAINLSCCYLDPLKKKEDDKTQANIKCVVTNVGTDSSSTSEWAVKVKPTDVWFRRMMLLYRLMTDYTEETAVAVKKIFLCPSFDYGLCRKVIVCLLQHRNKNQELITVSINKYVTFTFTRSEVLGLLDFYYRQKDPYATLNRYYREYHQRIDFSQLIIYSDPGSSCRWRLRCLHPTLYLVEPDHHVASVDLSGIRLLSRKGAAPHQSVKS